MNNTDLYNENLQLKKKCNAQVSFITSLQNKIELLEKKINENTEAVEQYGLILNRVLLYLCNANIFIKYKNDCKNARAFYKLKKEDFEEVVLSIDINTNVEVFKEYCFSIGLFKCNKKQYVFPDIYEGKNIKVVFVRKEAFEFIQNGNEVRNAME